MSFMHDPVVSVRVAREQLDFDQVIGILHSWIGAVVGASVDVGGGDDPVSLMRVTGRLRGSGDLVDEYASLIPITSNQRRSIITLGSSSTGGLSAEPGGRRTILCL